MQIFSHLDNQNLPYLQQWTGAALEHMHWRQSFADLADIKNAIVIVEANEANFQLTLTQRLIDHNNFLVFCDFFRSWFYSASHDILDRCHNLDKNYAVISSADAPMVPSVNLNEYYHSQATYPNRHRSAQVLQSWYDKTNKPYKFFFPTTRARPHRVQVAQILLQKGFLDSALWNWEAVVPDTAEFSGAQLPLTQLPLEYETPYADADRLEKFRCEQRMLFRMHDPYYRAHWSHGHIVPNRFVDSYFTVYVESDVTNICITENSYNALMSGHPMIVLAAPGYLARLRDMGFQTWDAVLDESYDSEPDLDKRLNMVIEQIARLRDMDPQELINSFWPIGEFNRTHYFANQFNVWQHTHTQLHQLFDQIKQIKFGSDQN